MIDTDEMFTPAHRQRERRRCIFWKTVYVLFVMFMLISTVCALWSHYDRLGWVRFVLALPCPGWLRTWLLGWS